MVFSQREPGWHFVLKVNGKWSCEPALATARQDESQDGFILFKEGKIRAKVHKWYQNHGYL